MPTAQFFHTTDIKIRMRILGLGKVRKVPELIPEQRAIEVGVQIFNELVFFGLFAGVLLFEYYRQREKEEVRQAKIEEEKLELKKCIHRCEIFGFFSSRSLKTREKYISFAQLVLLS